MPVAVAREGPRPRARSALARAHALEDLLAFQSGPYLHAYGLLFGSCKSPPPLFSGLEALFSSKIFYKINIIAFLFIFYKYYLIMN